MGVRDIRLWTCDVADCEVAAEKAIRNGSHQGDEKHELPAGWVSISVHAIRGHHNVGKWLCPHHANAHIMPLFPEYADLENRSE